MPTLAVSRRFGATRPERLLVGCLGFANFGDSPHPESIKVAEATEKVKLLRPDITIDGEMQVGVALSEDSRGPYPLCMLDGSARLGDDMHRGKRGLGKSPTVASSSLSSSGTEAQVTGTSGFVV